MKKGLFGLFSALLIVACSDDDLPEPTQEGANMLACRIDDNVWEANVVPGTDEPATEAHFFTSPNYVVITARRRGTDENEDIEISLFTLDGEGEYVIGLHTTNEGSYRIRHEDGGETLRRTTQQRGGEAKITLFDRNLKIIAGTFSFKATDGHGNGIEVTEGRFDIEMEVH